MLYYVTTTNYVAVIPKLSTVKQLTIY